MTPRLFDPVLPGLGKPQAAALEGGALREVDDPSRGYFELLPPGPLTRLAAHYGRGAAKYAPHNWEKGLETGRIMRSLLRHAFGYLAGNRDEDHLAAVAWNAFALMDHEDRLRSGELPRALDTLPCLREGSGRVVAP